jgi:ribose-phosphate pyrophosphokinase
MLFLEYFLPLLKDSELVVVSPDAGGTKRSERQRQLLIHALGKPVGAAFAEKHRSLGVVSGDMVVGDVKGKDVLIVDDHQHRNHDCAHSPGLPGVGGG